MPMTKLMIVANDYFRLDVLDFRIYVNLYADRIYISFREN